MSIEFDTPVQYLKGVGPKLGEVLHLRGVDTVAELLNWFPRGYEDRRAVRQIASLEPGQVVSLKARVVRVNSIPMGRSRRRLWEVVLADNTGRVHCKYFRVPFRGYFDRFERDQEVRLVGKTTLYRGRLEFHHPDIHPVGPDEASVDELIPLYTETEGLSPFRLRQIIKTALGQIPQREVLPEWILKKYNLLPWMQAIHQIHQPPHEQGDLYLKFRSPAQHRLIFDEFFWLELNLASRRVAVRSEVAHPLRSSGQLAQKLVAQLPFQLTAAQNRSLQEIVQDLSKPQPMHRLVQGDVGSGKTLVALLAAVHAHEAGAQTAIMVPTELLAEQHFKNAERLLTPLGVRVGLLTGHMKERERSVLLADLQAGLTHLVIGTHALIQSDVAFANLGLVVIDEQHRFGVQQRQRLRQKGLSPHFLVMTATPIPRTLAMTVYGDLDVSVIDELPQGRKPIVTRKVFASKRAQVWKFIADQLALGHQTYIVYPLVEESEQLDLKNAIEEYDKIRQYFANEQVGLLHGRMKAAEKDAVMKEFRLGKIKILVSTTVIEVGVDVPNATVMVIEHAERFGLSQLHQLRGRVGRGGHKSYCILVLDYAQSDEARQRAEIMERTNDGFKIAEFDLELRGPGEFLGTRQSGLPGFRLANLIRDAKILQMARAAAFELLELDPTLKRPEHLAVRTALSLQNQQILG